MERKKRKEERKNLEDRQKNWKELKLKIKFRANK
jgi:hypothetical protein